MIAALQRAAPCIARICKAILLAVAVGAALVFALWTPAVFGYRPFTVTGGACITCTPGALAYCRYAPAKTIGAGDSIAVLREDGMAVYAVTGRDDTARVFFCVEQGECEEIPFELSEGVVAAVYFPSIGYGLQALRRPAVCAALVGAAAVLSLGAFLLPRWGYQPKYGRSKD